MGQKGKAGSVMEKIMEAEKNTWKSKYILKYADTGKKVKTINLEQNESVSLNFYYDGVLQEFDITEEEYIDKYNLWVLSCIENPEVATIDDGTVTAKGKGETLLQLYCDGEIWEYKINVKKNNKSGKAARVVFFYLLLLHYSVDREILPCYIISTQCSRVLI